MNERIIYHLANGKKKLEPLHIPDIADKPARENFHPELVSKEHDVEADLAKIGAAMFDLEKQLRKSTIKKIQIPISPLTYKQIDQKEVTNALNELILFLLHKNIEVILKPKARKHKEAKKFLREECANICLFSGGVDSYSGILNSKATLKNVVAVFAYHFDQRRLSPIINLLNEKILKAEKIPLFVIETPPHGPGIAQTRGFLYLVCGAIFARLFHAKAITVSECGPTMYQPMFIPLDTVTSTTHPHLLSITKRFLKSFCGETYKILTPNEDLTKAEVISTSPMSEFLNLTHSCITIRYGQNLGACYGCILRKLAFLVAGVRDCVYPADVLMRDINDILYPYRRGIVGQYTETVEALMKFSCDMIFDYESMPFYSKEKIEEFKKHDLFRRFALDNFSGLYLLFNGNGAGRNSRVRKLYQQMRKSFTKEQLEERIEEVRSGKFKPDFNKII